MADITRPLLNRIKEKIRGSDYYIVVSMKNNDITVSSNLNEEGQLKFLADVGERLLKRHTCYLAQSEEPTDGGSA